MALKKSELYSSLWRSCDELRGGMDASQYKDYVLVLLFIKYVSDKYAGQPYAPITIPPGASFKDMVALKGKSDIGDQIGQPVHHLLAAAELGGVVEVGKIGELVGILQWGDDLLVDLVTDVALALEGDQVFEARAFGDRDRCVLLAGIFVADVFDEEQHEDIVLVLAGVHAAAQLVAALPEGTIEFGLLQGHSLESRSRACSGGTR